MVIVGTTFINISQTADTPEMEPRTHAHTHIHRHCVADNGFVYQLIWIYPSKHLFRATKMSTIDYNIGMTSSFKYDLIV